MRKKVLYIITAGDTGGAQKYVHDLAANLDAQRFETKILYGGTDPSAGSGQCLHWLSNRVSPFLLWNDWLAIAELVAVFRREQPNVIHLNSSKAGVVGSLAAAIYKATCPVSRVPCPKIIFTAHGWVFNPSNYYSPFVRWAYRTLHRIAAHFQDTIINVSEYDRELALASRIAPPEKLVTIHNGIDPNIPFLKREAARKEIHSRLDPIPLPDRQAGYTLNPRLPWIGSIGRLTKEKDYATLVAAASEIPNAYFFIIGAGPEKQKLTLLITRYALQNRFSLVPPTGNDAVLLKAFNAFTLCSIKEGLPYTLLEALTAGVPSVVTDAGGMREAVRHCPAAVVAPLRNPKALAAKIQQLIERGTGRSCVPFPIAGMVVATTALYAISPTKPLPDQRVAS